MLTTNLIVVTCTVVLFALSVSALVLLPAISVDRSTHNRHRRRGPTESGPC